MARRTKKRKPRYPRPATSHRVQFSAPESNEHAQAVLAVLNDVAPRQRSQRLWALAYAGLTGATPGATPEPEPTGDEVTPTLLALLDNL